MLLTSLGKHYIILNPNVTNQILILNATSISHKRGIEPATSRLRRTLLNVALMDRCDRDGLLKNNETDLTLICNTCLPLSVHHRVSPLIG